MITDDTIQRIEGDPNVVAGRSQEFLRTANGILAAADELLTVTNRQETISVAVDEVRSLAEQVHGEIMQAQERYQAAALALSDFAPVLASAQRRANEAADAYFPQARAAQEAHDELLYRAFEPEERESARHAWQLAQGRASASRDEYFAAVAGLRVASDEAAARIRVVIDQSDLNDSLWDDLAGMGEHIGQWFAEVFGPMIEVLLDVLAKVVQVLAMAVSLVLLLSLWQIIAIDALLYLGTGDEGFLNEAVALVVIGLSPMIGAAWLTGHGTPSVERIHQSTRTSPRADGHTPFASAITDQAAIDRAGADGVLGDDSGVIQVTTVVGADGVTTYRVQIPSTQQWFSPGGSAPNDLDGNLWAKFFPGQRSQLEKAVELALLEAGYIPGSGADVMLSGFSQGGIAAANLAADPDFTRRFDVTTVFTVGSPIGDVPIPPEIAVVAIEHDTDPVPHADFFTENPKRDNWITIATTPSSPEPEFFGHNTADYAESAAREIDLSSDPRIVEFREGQQRFFIGTETVQRFEARRG